MTNLERLKLELGNKEYFSNEEYSVFLDENDLNSDGGYDKIEDNRNLLLTCLDVLEAVANDIDLMRKVETEFTTTSQAYSYLEKRIESIKDKIAAIEDEQSQYGCFSLMFTRDR